MTPGEIVVGTDGSSHGTTAVRWAAGAAERGRRPLRVVVAYHWQVPGRWYGTVGELTAAADERSGGIATDAVAVARAAAPHVEVDCSVLLGEPAPVLLKVAEEASLLVVGHRGRGGFGGLLLGTVNGVQRLIDTGTGNILEKAVSAAGQNVAEKVVGNITQLPVLSQTTDAAGNLVKRARDAATNAIVQYTLSKAGKLLGASIVQAATR